MFREQSCRIFSVTIEAPRTPESPAHNVGQLGLRQSRRAWNPIHLKNSTPVIGHAPQWAAETAKGEALWKALMPDGIHPNAKGCEQVMMPVLLKALGICGSVAV